MGIFKCKMCGGVLEINEGSRICVCTSCGIKQTLPRLDSERRVNLYDRANHFRRNSEFDKAMSIYETILNEDTSDAEAYWSILLCKYGIEYVEDPVTHKRSITCNRTQYTSVFSDEDYKSAIEYADEVSKTLYIAEANEIDRIQKEILAISAREEPFDVFICYKEVDINGRRTQDSVLAQELYFQLKNEGFKVFFSRITLESKLGTAYEPYIFAALNSAKVMVVVATRQEHVNSAWVKNEWGRYLAIAKNNSEKILIPAYRDMDPYDLPDEFSHLQALDMSKLGFMQDLVRGIQKIVGGSKTNVFSEKEKVTPVLPIVGVLPLLKRAFLFLEDAEFERADEFAEQVLNQDPENAEAYLIKLMIELRVKKREELVNCEQPFDSNRNYLKVIRFADNNLKNNLQAYNASIKERNRRALEEDRKEKEYLLALRAYNSMDIIRLENAIKAFQGLKGYKDSDKMAELCWGKIEQIRNRQEQIRAEQERQAELWRIAQEETRLAKEREATLHRIEREKRSKRNKKIAMIATPILILAAAFLILLFTVIIPAGKYDNAVALMNAGKYDNAIAILDGLHGYKDSKTKIAECYSKKLSIPADKIIVSSGQEAPQFKINNGVITVKADAAVGSEVVIPHVLDGQVVTEIGNDAFAHLEGRDKITSITIPETVVNIGERAFSGCKSLYNVSIPNGVKTIGAEAFKDCSSLTNITIPNGITVISEGVFSNCSNLSGVVIPNSVESIGNFAFYKTGLTSLELPQKEISFGAFTFAYCTQLEKVEIPYGVTDLSQSLFFECTSLFDVKIPSSVKKIEKSAFNGCCSLITVSIPKGVESIGDHVFYRCTRLKTVYVPNSVKHIEENVFCDCNNLTSLTLPFIGFAEDNLRFSYLFADEVPSSLKTVVVTGGKSIPASAFRNCENIQSITLPNSITSIGNYAFYGCKSLSSFTIPSSVKSIGASAFENCEDLSSLTIPDGVLSIGNYAFRNCYSLRNLVIPSSVSSLGEAIFP